MTIPYQFVYSLVSSSIDLGNVSLKLLGALLMDVGRPVWWFYLVQQILTEACYGPDLGDTEVGYIHPRPERANSLIRGDILRKCVQSDGNITIIDLL